MTPGGIVRVPTLHELLRVKGWLVVTRNATRDYIDFAASSTMLDDAGVREALRRFDELYVDIYRAEAGRDVSPLLQLARQLCEPRPYDLDETDVAHYKGITEPLNSWDSVRGRCAEVAVLVAELLTD